jgi:hypothetical protein
LVSASSDTPFTSQRVRIVIDRTRYPCRTTTCRSERSCVTCIVLVGPHRWLGPCPRCIGKRDPQREPAIHLCSRTLHTNNRCEEVELRMDTGLHLYTRAVRQNATGGNAPCPQVQGRRGSGLDCRKIDWLRRCSPSKSGTAQRKLKSTRLVRVCMRPRCPWALHGQRF